MAYDKIIPIRRRMVRCIDYVLDEDKTDLANALYYSENPVKTQRLVTGINCDPNTALADMNATKRRWDKTGGVLGYHIIHSYAPGEVTPEDAHAAGVELAERLLGDRYEAVVSTHLDREHLHCHIVFNSVSFVDGRKYRDDFKSYYEDLRGISNDVSRERGLSVIEPAGHGKHYAEWNAERSGKSTIRGLVRQDIDAAIAESITYATFLAAPRRKIRGFRALYLRYVYLLRGYRRPRRRPPPFAVRKEVAKLQRAPAIRRASRSAARRARICHSSATSTERLRTTSRPRKTMCWRHAPRRSALPPMSA